MPESGTLLYAVVLYGLWHSTCNNGRKFNGFKAVFNTFTYRQASGFLRLSFFRF